jgi:hypothetical protein
MHFGTEIDKSANDKFSNSQHRVHVKHTKAVNTTITSGQASQHHTIPPVTTMQSESIKQHGITLANFTEWMLYKPDTCYTHTQHANLQQANLYQSVTKHVHKLLLSTQTVAAWSHGRLFNQEVQGHQHSWVWQVSQVTSDRHNHSNSTKLIRLLKSDILLLAESNKNLQYVECNHCTVYTKCHQIDGTECTHQ